MKKKINIVLILAVLGLWGTVIYKAVHQYLFPQKIETVAYAVKKGISADQMKKDTFQLQPLTRDPFLNTIVKSQQAKPVASNANHFKKKLAPAITPVIVNKNWPAIVYYGNMTSEVTNQSLFILKIDKKMYNLKLNEEVQGLKVKNVYKDSILVLFNKDKKYIKINK